MGNAFRSVLASGGAGTPITPSDSSPVSMTGGETYEPTTNGYAIASYTNVTPTTSGTYFSSGMKKMSLSGYAYSSKPTPAVKRLITSGTSNQTISSNIKIGDYLLLGSATQKDITGATYVSAISSSGQYQEYLYRVTSTTITVPASSTSQTRWLDVISI